ncbi:SAM-dependent methyltransferase [Kribbella pittospori]|uniref:SAM-dependent methyltransferase n=1 Tax=Kribbella pittospori TaxID=722689 RepID=A0A4R0K9J9_9ACTN|nr:N-6 DNA methylase [Kribbella pittospori]TCC55987.1 SAM-dependent methyltransferase [Kribbella pittospori]
MSSVIAQPPGLRERHHHNIVCEPCQHTIRFGMCTRSSFSVSVGTRKRDQEVTMDRPDAESAEGATGTVSSVGIARLAGVGRAAVSNWRRRYADFPEPVGGTPTSPSFDLAAVEQWLTAQGKLPEVSGPDRAWREIAAASDGPDLGGALWLAGLMLFHRSVGSDATSSVPAPSSLAASVGRVNRAAEELFRSELPDSWLPRHLTVLSAAAGVAGDPVETFERFYALYLRARGAASDYVTPVRVARLILSLTDIATGASSPCRSVADVMDLACGTGSLLVEAVRGGGGVRVFGQDLDPTAACIAQVRLMLTSKEQSAVIRVGDSLRADAFPGERVDLVVSNPPFGLHDWADDQLAFDPRWEYGGLPPRTEPELAWVQDALAHLRPGGQAVLLMPPVAAWRSAGRRIRGELLRRGVVRAVVALPSGLLPATSVGLHLWVLRRPADGQVADRVLMVDASRIEQATAEAVIELAVPAWRSYEREPASVDEQAGLVKLVPVIDMLDEEVDLTPARHLAVSDDERRDPTELLASGEQVLKQLREVAASLPTLLPVEQPAMSEVRALSLDELVRISAVGIFRGHSRLSVDAEDVSEPGVTGGDVVRGGGPSGRAPGTAVRIEAGDVLVPAVGSSVVARVATAEQIGVRLGQNVSLIRADPARVDPWFLAGMVTAPTNRREATRQASGTRDIVRVNLKRLQVPLLPMDEQRRYGEAFRRLVEFDAMLDKAADETHRLVKELSAALTRGSLVPESSA